MNIRIQKRIGLILVITSVFWQIGCVATPTSSIDINPVDNPNLVKTLRYPKYFTEYILGPRDVLEILVWEEDELAKIQGVHTDQERMTEYMIGARDILEISVWQCEELCKEIKVRPDGKISFPLVGDIKAHGLTPTELAEELTERLAIYVKEPKVSVGVKEFSGKKVFVLGEVANPGVYTLEHEAKIIDLISMAGGYTEDAILQSAKVIRGEPKEENVIIVDLVSLIERGDIDYNVFIREGDIVYIPKAFIEEEISVRADGNLMLPLIGDIHAAGLTPRELVSEIRLRVLFNTDVRPGVSVRIKEFGGNKVFVLGEVTKPGVYIIEEQSRIVDVLSMAGGYTENAVLQSTRVIRGELKKENVITVDVASLVKRGNMQQNIVIREGDIIYVPNSTIASINYILRQITPVLYTADVAHRMGEW
ncbi:MAG: polysaccharide export protein [Candidatus Omnitrophica bacterium]|nr:polysaccharide export protein [Candidatus Omnitrophota bacterium]